MPASPLTNRIITLADFRKWVWWSLPAALRLYVGALTIVAAGAIAFAATRTSWNASDALRYAILLSCSIVACTAKPGKAYRGGGMTRDFMSAWLLPVAILLPPLYAMVTPIPLQVLTQLRVQKGIIFRRVFTVAAMGLTYGAASLLFRSLPPAFAGGGIGSGRHALTWTLAVAVCELVGGRGHHIMIAVAVKLSDPRARVLRTELTRESLQADFAESDLGILITVVCGIAPLLEMFAVPTVLLIRRFMMHEQLLAQARTDTKTGLLNASTWEAEAAGEVARAVRTGAPVSVLLIDIDHFKRVNDTYGHLVGDTALRAVTDAIRQHLRSYDLAGRFGGEEFVVLLPNARESDAIHIAERLRKHVAALDIPAGGDTDQDGPRISLTVSVGVSSVTDPTQELPDLMAAADAAMYHAKQNGRNKTSVVRVSGPVALGGASQPAGTAIAATAPAPRSPSSPAKTG